MTLVSPQKIHIGDLSYINKANENTYFNHFDGIRYRCFLGSVGWHEAQAF